MSKIIYKGLVEQNRLYEEQKKLNTQIDVFRRSGLDDAAKRLLPEYNKIVSEIKRLDSVVEHQRRNTSHALLVCFVIADLATLAADQFADVCKRECVGLTSADDEFVKMMRFHAETSAKRWNELVCILDEGGNERLSYYFADFSEQITDTLLPAVNAAVREVMNTGKGRKML